MGDGIAAPYIESFIQGYIPALSSNSKFIGEVISFLLITGFFIEFADLVPRRMAMVSPEKISTGDSCSYECIDKDSKTSYLNF